MFQHTAARRRLGSNWEPISGWIMVSTHSRPKAAGDPLLIHAQIQQVSTHSRPKAAGAASLFGCYHRASFNTQPPEGGWKPGKQIKNKFVGFNTQPPEGGWLESLFNKGRLALFQHTAARRRLGSLKTKMSGNLRFNTQPPEGGWFSYF